MTVFRLYDLQKVFQLRQFHGVTLDCILVYAVARDADGLLRDAVLRRPDAVEAQKHRGDGVLALLSVDLGATGPVRKIGEGKRLFHVIENYYNKLF